MTFFTKSGAYCQHEVGAISIIEEIISEFKPDVVIELGTKQGGFTEVIQKSTEDNVDIFTYDNRAYSVYGKFRDNVYFIINDVLKEPLRDIIDICSSDNKVLLYCDNGSKRREIELYSKYLKKGDMLGVHDWGTEVFSKDVMKYLKRFTSVRREEFKNRGWKTRFWKRG